MLDLKAQPVCDFLDAADIVLNSNTFILEFDVRENLKVSFFDFLNSGNLIGQILRQDKDREWNNLRYFDVKTDSYIPKPGELAKPGTDSEIQQPTTDKREYLISMLTANAGCFFSFYSMQKERNTAEILVDNLILFLSGGNPWQLFTITPNFLTTDLDIADNNPDHISYFGGDYGNDSATIIVCREKAYLLLTNGID